MRRVVLLSLLVACGDDAGSSPDAPGLDGGIDAPPSECSAIPAFGQFVARDGNPRLRAGNTFGDGKQDTSMSDPDLRWNEGEQRWEAYWMAAHGTTFNAPDLVQVIRMAVSPDKTSWAYVDEPVFTANPDPDAWDHTHSETPSVVYNPDAPADRKYILYYSGSREVFPFPGYTFQNYAIGAAISADGITFTRVPSAETDYDEDGLVLTDRAVYPGATGAIVADPEVVLVNGTYHLFYSSFACGGTSCETVQAYGIGHSTSPDGIHWTTAEAPVRSLLREQITPTSGGGQPSVIYDAEHCRWELWLQSDLPGENDNQPIEFNNMVGVYRAESADGITWSVNYSRARDFQWAEGAPRAGERLGLLTGADVAANGNGRLMLYVGFDDQNVPQNYFLPDRTPQGFRAGVMTLNIATRDLP